MTRDELRIKVAEKMGWRRSQKHFNLPEYWTPDTGLAPPQWQKLPDLDHWVWRFVVDLARKGYYLYGLSDYFAVFPVGRPSDHEAVCRNADADIAVCTAWLAVCAKGGA